MIVLAFNQERFVREAVEAALAQDYGNLEILLSDHGSRDRTYEIMAQLAAGYAGPHRVLLHQSTARGGVLGHVYDALGRTSGALVVGAAGDDISYPHRVSRLAECWRRTGAAVLFSASDGISDTPGSPPPAATQQPVHDAADYFPPGAVRHVHGATAAYDRTALDAVSLPGFEVMSEDFFLTLMLGLRSARFEFLPEPLIKYRRHAGALSSQGGFSPTLEACERAVASYSARAARILRHAEHAARTGIGISPSYGAPACVNLRRLRADAAFHEARARWYASGFVGRLAALRHVRRRSQLRWMVPRLFGLRGLAALKRLRPEGEVGRSG